jgi:hypothetical protein
MNKYELLTENKQLIYQFVKNGILSYLMIRDIEIYETYLNLNDNITKEKNIYYYQTNTNYHQIE